MKKLLLTLIVLFMSVSVYGLDITCQWDANTEPDLAGYRIYWKADSSGQPSGDYDGMIDVGNVTTGTIENLNPASIDTVYYVAITAYDTSGLESDFSDEVNTEGLMPDEYLYLPPASPTGNTILNAFNTFPDGTTIQITEPGHAIVTYPNGMIIEIVGTVVTVTPPPTE